MIDIGANEKEWDNSIAAINKSAENIKNDLNDLKAAGKQHSEKALIVNSVNDFIYEVCAK